mmetsp:Transcript_23362/g.49812  ORF Transcript_23362/g.49812 Transcript_23362/m.49812 type:complete len:438 (-) Transcript_23362:316-1629(-)
MPTGKVAANLARVGQMEESDALQVLQQSRRQMLRRDAELEMKNTKYNMSKLQESWLKIMRSAKTKTLKKQVEIISQNHERDVDRRDAILQMLDRDLDEAEEQHQVAVRTHLLNVDRLLEIQQSRLLALEDDFNKDVQTLRKEFDLERTQIQEKHALEKRELMLIIEQVEREEKSREQADSTDYLSQLEMIRNRNIEEDHQMKSGLEQKIEDTRTKCKEKLQHYQNTTESSTADYKDDLQRDALLSKQVERKLRQVTRMHEQIQHWKLKISQNKQDCEERNTQLRTEKDHIAKHFQELKAKMNHFRTEEKKRLADLTQNARNCIKSLNDQLSLAEKNLEDRPTLPQVRNRTGKSSSLLPLARAPDRIRGRQHGLRRRYRRSEKGAGERGHRRMVVLGQLLQTLQQGQTGPLGHRAGREEVAEGELAVTLDPETILGWC